MKIKINWEVTQTTGSETVTLEELNLTKEEWNNLSEEDKEEKLQEYLDELPERVGIVVDTF